MPGTSTELADLARTQVPVPTAVALFPHDITFAPKSWCERSYTLRRYTAFESVSSRNTLVACLWLGRLSRSSYIVEASSSSSRVPARRCGQGGHFASLEEPEAFVDDVRSFFLGDLGLGGAASSKL